jgi:hypothetical protein
MINYLTYIKDIAGNNYIGLKIDPNLISNFLKELESVLGESDFEEFTNYQKQRDKGSYHITVINVMDYNKLSKEIGPDKFINSLEPIFKYPIDDLKMLGIGTAEKAGNRTYFIVCKSDKLESIRKTFNLQQHDFHITIGFKHKDIFGVRKNEVMKKESRFLQLLRSEFLKRENFEFIKKIENWDESPDDDIIPISITDDFLKVKVRDNLMDIGLSDDGKLTLFTKYKDESDSKRIPTTEIINILKQK